MPDTMKQLPKTPMLPSDVNDIKGLMKAIWDHIIKNNQLDNEQIKRIQDLETRVKALEDA